MRRWLIILIVVAAALASFTFKNTAYTAVNASLSPVSKDFNASISPLAFGYFQFADAYNVTYYRMKFMPGWTEVYTIGKFRPTGAGWAGRLEVVAGNRGGTYAIRLGDVVQITGQQNSGPAVSLPALLVWQTTTTQRYSILARALFTQSGVTVTQLVNFTAEPMQKKAEWTFHCHTQTHTDDFQRCTTANINFGWDNAYAPAGVTYNTWTRGNASVALDNATRRSGTHSLRLQADGTSTITYGVAALRWDLGGLGVTTDLEIQVYNQLVYGDKSVDEITYIQFEVETPTGIVYLYYVRLTSDWGTGPRTTEVWDVFNGQRVCTSLSPTGCGSSVPTGHQIRVLGHASGDTFSAFFPTGFNLKRDVGIDGVVRRMAFVVVDGKNADGAAKSWFDDLTMTWHKCQLPSHIVSYTAGQPNTGVYIAWSTPLGSPALVTQVDARGGGSVATDYGYAIAQYRLPTPIPAAGTQISVLSRYERDSADAPNNVFFISIGVDTDGNGVVDREYIYYRNDGTPFVLVSSFINPGQVICLTTSTCQNTMQYFFKHVGTAASGNDYQWSISLGETPGAIIGVAFGAVDASGSASGLANDFWVFWDDLAVQYSACPRPAGWHAGGYVWQSYNYLLVTGGVAYVPLVAGGLTYVANFTGSGRYVVVGSGLGDIFGVYWSGAGAGCVFSPPQAGARYVELRPLAALGDIIVRDAFGGMLWRAGCQTTGIPAYIAFKANPGEVLRVYSLEVWG